MHTRKPFYMCILEEVHLSAYSAQSNSLTVRGALPPSSRAACALAASAAYMQRYNSNKRQADEQPYQWW